MAYAHNDRSFIYHVTIQNKQSANFLPFKHRYRCNTVVYMVYDSMIISLVNKLTTFPHSWHSWNNADDQLINRIVIDKSFTLQDKTLSG